MVNWGMCCFFYFCMSCKGFLWDWLEASLWSYRVRMSATEIKPFSALSFGHLVWSYFGHHWWMLSTSPGLVEGETDHILTFCLNLCVHLTWPFLCPSTTLCRKSWLVPTQYLLGLFMLYLSVTVNSLLQSEGGPNVVTLTAVFFMLAFLAATQVASHKHCSRNRIQKRRFQFHTLSFSFLGHSCGWLGPNHVIQGKCGLCIYMQLCRPDSWLLPGQCAISSSGVGWLLQQIPQTWAQRDRHHYSVRYVLCTSRWNGLKRYVIFFVIVYKIR